MPHTAVVIGPRDQGRRMTLEDFEFAEVKEGFHYELSRGVIAVSDVPSGPHCAQVTGLRDRFTVYKMAHPQHLCQILAGSECKLLIPDTDSERHPDLALYLKPQPALDYPWRIWLPEIVVEVVSISSQVRDYEEKPKDYWQLGVKEYWIVDAERRELLVLKRQRGKWLPRVVADGESHTTRLLPGFTLELAPIFAAADAARG